MSLFVHVVDPVRRALLRNHLQSRRVTDSGCDLLTPECVAHGLSTTIHLGIHVAAVDADGNPAPCMLIPRSSLSNTPLRLCNSIGLIDMGYRGEVMAKVDNLSPNEFGIQESLRLFQIVQHNWLPWKEIVVVEKLSELPTAPDNRGSGGFGSTGK